MQVTHFYYGETNKNPLENTLRVFFSFKVKYEAEYIVSCLHDLVNTCNKEYVLFPLLPNSTLKMEARTCLLTGITINSFPEGKGELVIKHSPLRDLSLVLLNLSTEKTTFDKLRIYRTVHWTFIRQLFERPFLNRKDEVVFINEKQ